MRPPIVSIFILFTLLSLTNCTPRVFDNPVDPEVTNSTPVYKATVATPTFDTLAGTYAGPMNIQISCTTTGAAIHYTVNGTTPTSSNGTVYSSSVFISTNTVSCQV